MGEQIPVLWLCGPSGVGKTTVAWEIYSELLRTGAGAGYVDIDQLGMCYPERVSDPGRHRLEAANLGRVLDGFRAAGARCVVVSGVVDAAHGVHVDELPQAGLTVCRLRSTGAELARRLAGRIGQAGQLGEVLAEADALDRTTFADVCIDTSDLPVPEIARLVRERTGGWPASAGTGPPAVTAEPGGPPSTDADGGILWLCGATGVGKSTVGFAVYQRTLRAGQTAAYIDLDQLGFCDPGLIGKDGNHRLKARNLAGMWQNYRAAGAQRLVMVGPAEDAAAVGIYADALPAATIAVCRLHAGPEQLTRRILLRGEGGSWPQPGDPLAGRSTGYLLEVAEDAVAKADDLERAAVGDLRIDTSGYSVDEAADKVLARTGWPTPGSISS